MDPPTIEFQRFGIINELPSLATLFLVLAAHLEEICSQKQWPSCRIRACFVLLTLSSAYRQGRRAVLLTTKMFAAEG